LRKNPLQADRKEVAIKRIFGTSEIYGVMEKCEFMYPFRFIIRLNEREMFLTARASNSVVFLRKYGIIAM